MLTPGSLSKTEPPVEFAYCRSKVATSGLLSHRGTEQSVVACRGHARVSVVAKRLWHSVCYRAEVLVPPRDKHMHA